MDRLLLKNHVVRGVVRMGMGDENDIDQRDEIDSPPRNSPIVVRMAYVESAYRR